MKVPQLTPSTIIEGRWNKNKYEVKKKLGQGGIATVYLVSDIRTKQEYAIKISEASISINREYELLKKFSKVDMIVKVYEIDDIKVDGQIYFYILLEYIQGENLKDYSKNNRLNSTIIIPIIIILLKGLMAFHDEEYIVGDLKLENLMVDKKNKKMKIIDLGGVVRKGQSIKEFTPLYDRTSWKCGERVADTSYDIFMVMMIFIRLLIKEPIHPKGQRIEDVIVKLKGLDLDKGFQDCIIDGLLGRKCSLDYYIEKLKKLYRIERSNELQERLLSREKKTNRLLCFSVLFFIATIVFLFLISI